MTPLLLRQGGRFALLLALLLAPFLSLAVRAEAIRDLTYTDGIRENQLLGYGLVVGLDGTGDQTTQTPFTVQSILSMLSQYGVNLSVSSLQLKNVAAVMVTAMLPPFARPGQPIDVTVSSLGNAKILRGGTLVLTPLKGADGKVYAMAQGNVLVPGASASGGGSSVQVNQLAVGRIPTGATVERSVDSPVGQGEYVYLGVKAADFTTTLRVVDRINTAFGPQTATAVDARRIQVRAPVESTRRVEFLSRLENLTVVPADAPARVIINARTGSVVMNQMVRISECAVAHGSLTVTVSSESKVSQPNALSNGQTVVTEQAQVEIKNDKSQMVLVPAAARLSDIVRALNAVGATPIDLLSILQAMKAAGALKAELEII
jgi:flagellar P-ring protein FlgI